MRILHFILGKGNKSRANGVNQVIAGIAKYSIRQGAHVHVVGMTHSIKAEGKFVPQDGFQVQVFSRFGRHFMHVLECEIRRADLVHLHGVFSKWNILIAMICKRNNVPYVVTAHNGLAPELMNARSKVKKSIFHWLLQRKHIEEAAGVHALTEEEATDIYNCAAPKYVFCIPNGIDLDDFGENPFVPRPLSSNVVLGYLGRLSPEKNLDSLCQAFININADGTSRLKLAGPDSTYGRNLLSKYGSKGVEWVGPKFDAEKTSFIRSIDLFVHPSLCDVFSISAMETLALKTPLLITRTSKASYFQNSQSFFMCEPTCFGLERGMRLAISQRASWGSRVDNGRRLIEDSMNWASVTQNLLVEYERILSKRSA